MSLVVYLSLVTGEFIAYKNNEYGSDDDEDDDDDSINSFIFTILFVKPTKKEWYHIGPKVPVMISLLKVDFRIIYYESS